jgi:4-alpha-glucanotransferase
VAARVVDVAPESVIAVLDRLGVDASTPAAAAGRAGRVRRNRPAARHRRAHRGGDRPGPAGELVLEDGSVVVGPGRNCRRTCHRAITRWSHDGGRTPVIVTPARLAGPPHTWGWLLQLYALRSAGSWGMGDLATWPRRPPAPPPTAPASCC